MHTMYEALARERLLEEHRRAHEAHLASTLAARRRWRRRSVRASAAEARHARRLEVLPTQ